MKQEIKNYLKKLRITAKVAVYPSEESFEVVFDCGAIGEYVELYQITEGEVSPKDVILNFLSWYIDQIPDEVKEQGFGEPGQDTDYGVTPNLRGAKGWSDVAKQL